MSEQDDVMWGRDEWGGELESCLDYAVERATDGWTSSMIREAGSLIFQRCRRRKVVPREDWIEQVLETLFDSLSEEYDSRGCLESLDKEPSPQDLDAARSFVEDVCKRYVPWQCEPDGHTETVNLVKWCEENAPELLEE